MDIGSKKSKIGFTLIELMVVISIIGLVAGMALAAMSGTRAQARDSRRKQDMQRVAQAVEMYYLDKGSYVLAGGWNNGGTGWFNYVGGVNYTRAIAVALSQDGGKIPVVADPTGATTCSPTARYCYMFYRCGNGFYIYAKLEKPTAQDLATCNATTCCTTIKTSYGMNYAVGHR